VACGFWLLPGCSSDNDGGQPTTRPASVRDRQDAALRDPFGYKSDVDQYDVSGGGIGEFDRDAMKRDIDHVFNP
jgi:hypothetical protein